MLIIEVTLSRVELHNRLKQEDVCEKVCQVSFRASSAELCGGEQEVMLNK